MDSLVVDAFLINTIPVEIPKSQKTKTQVEYELKGTITTILADGNGKINLAIVPEINKGFKSASFCSILIDLRGIGKYTLVDRGGFLSLIETQGKEVREIKTFGPHTL